MSLENLFKAYDFAKKAHEGQKRKTGEPYITHLIAVAEIARQYGADDTALCAALLHDVVEDTLIELKEIREKFGDEVAFLVDGVTHVVDAGTGKTIHGKTNRKILNYSEKDRRVALIKLADRVHNLSTPFDSQEPSDSQEGRKKYLGYEKWYENLAGRFGYSQFIPVLKELTAKIKQQPK